MTEREALKLALDAFGEIAWSNETQWQRDRAKEAITAIKEALAQPEQEPDYYGLTSDHLWMSITKDHYNRLKPEFRMACYTTQPQRKPLTDEDIGMLAKQSQDGISPHDDTLRFARAIEAAHGIKGLA